jgi:thioredoxin reductase (NADPH)
MYDVVIIGGGPAGLTAALYSSRRGLKTIVISKDIGGQVTRATEIENYPGIDKISGVQLAMDIMNQAKKFGAEFDFDEVTKISKEDKEFTVSTTKKQIKTLTVILAFGKKPQELGVEGEDRLKGRGVSYCATCDVPFFKDKILAVVGGGNSALDAALYSSSVARKVYLIHRRDQFRGDEVLVKKVSSTKNIEILYNSQVEKIAGKDKVEEIILSNGDKIVVDGIIIEVGFYIDRSIVEKLVKMDETNQIEIDKFQATSEKGVFAAGDLTTTPFKQIVIASAEGAKAALSAYDYIQKLKGKKGILADWH